MAGASSAVAVLGAGSWGTALAALIARHGHRTVLWGRDAAIVEAIDQRHENPRYLPGIALPEGPRATTHLAAARSEKRLVGNKCVSTCRSRWSPYPKKTTK